MAFIMLPLISPQCYLSSQQPPCHRALLLPLPCSSCYSGQAKPQLSHMPCLLDVWTKLGGSEARTDLLSESDPVRRDGWKCLPLWFPEEQRRKTNGVWLPYFLKVLEVTRRSCGTRAGAVIFTARLPSCPVVCQSDTMEKAPQPSLACSSPFSPRHRPQQSQLSGTADNSVSLLTWRWPGE